RSAARDQERSAAPLDPGGDPDHLARGGGHPEDVRPGSELVRRKAGRIRVPGPAGEHDDAVLVPARRVTPAGSDAWLKTLPSACCSSTMTRTSSSSPAI